ncbi:MAG: CynX/NimT family MFS transporter [Burkholderiaceae bacterium]
MTLSAGSRFSAPVILIVGIVAAFGAGKLPPVLLILSESYGLSLFEASFLISMFQLAGALIGVFAGSLADRFGHRTILQLGLAMTLMGIAVSLLANSAAVLLVSRAIESFGFILTVLPCPVLLRQSVGLERQRLWLGVWGSYMPAGFAAGLLAAPWLVTLSIQANISLESWRWVWLGHGLLVVASWFAFRLLGGAPLPQTTLARSERHPKRAFAALLKLTLGSSGPWLLGISFGAYAGQYLSIVSFLPTIYQQAGISLATAGAMTALVAGINLFGNLAAGWLTQRGVNAGKLMLAAALALFLGAWLVYASGLPFGVRYVIVVATSAIAGLIPGAMFTLAPRYAPTPDTVSSTVGLMQQVSAIGQFVLPPIVAWSAALAGGWSNAAWALSTMALVNIALAAVIVRRERAAEQVGA